MLASTLVHLRKSCRILIANKEAKCLKGIDNVSKTLRGTALDHRLITKPVIFHRQEMIRHFYADADAGQIVVNFV